MKIREAKYFNIVIKKIYPIPTKTINQITVILLVLSIFPGSNIRSGYSRHEFSRSICPNPSVSYYISARPSPFPMRNEIANIAFNHAKNPGMEFDVFSLEELLGFWSLEFDPCRHHRVEFYVMVLVSEGRGRHSIDFQEFEYERGTLITIRKDQFHKYYKGKVKGINLLFTEEFAVSYLDETSSRKVSELFNELIFRQHTQLESPVFEEVQGLIHQMRHEFEGKRDEYTSGIIRNLLQVVISKAHRARMAHIQVDIDDRNIQQFLSFQNKVQEACRTSRAVQYYADQLNVSPKTLYNITQKIIHKSPKAFIDEELMLQIKRLLLNSQLSVKEIAFQSGFEEPGNFSKFFKRLSGESPESFRHTHLHS